ncbi:hypothetical protein [Methylobacterium tarhaniae]|uniref:hypothetical protein n=1 Tax=Methylobacterium tarhaniae TaxID=1187852 RepID=UPI0012EEDD03|nr:hypothetical protein [Methylobacterium tarhaniae]
MELMMSQDAPNSAQAEAIAQAIADAVVSTKAQEVALRTLLALEEKRNPGTCIIMREAFDENLGKRSIEGTTSEMLVDIRKKYVSIIDDASKAASIGGGPPYSAAMWYVRLVRRLRGKPPL